MAPPRPPKPKLQPKAMVIMMKPMEQAGGTPAVGEDSIKTAEEFFKMGRVQAMTQSKNVFKMADILLEMDDDTWTWGYPYNSPVLGEMADNVWNLGFLPAAHRPQAVVPVMQWMQNMPLLKSETVEYCNGDNNPENLHVSGQVIQDSIPDKIFQRIKLGMHGNDLKLVEQGTESLLQTGSSGSPGGEQVGNLAAGSDAQALGGLTKQNFHGAGHAQC